MVKKREEANGFHRILCEMLFLQFITQKSFSLILIRSSLGGIFEIKEK